VSALVAIREHRARLVERAAAERDELGRQLAEWEGPLVAVDRGVSVVRALKRAPLLRLGAAVGMAALAFARPRSIMGWVVGGQAAYRLLTRVRGMVRRPKPGER